jgi:aerobic carbon-monoxide dehydrogenase medium subunit
MIPAAVRYLRAKSYEQAFEALADPEAKVLAGGQSLLPVLKLRVVRPSLLVDIGGLDGAGAEVRDRELAIGALVTWDALSALPELETPGLAAVRECAATIGDLQVRNRGTLGGSLAHADPASDMPAALLALGARIVLRSAGGERTVDAADFFLGPFQTALGAGEILSEVRVPVPPAGSGSAYEKIEHPASGFALAGAAVLVRADGSRSLAVTGLGARPFLLAEEADLAGALAAAEIYGDERAPAEYRRHLAGIVARRALTRATDRAQGAT